MSRSPSWTLQQSLIGCLDLVSYLQQKFIEEFFINSIVHFYENTVPQMYRKLDMLANKDDTQPIYVDLKHKLDVVRVELLKVFRNCLATCLNSCQENV
jgi:hypothetical protein